MAPDVATQRSSRTLRVRGAVITALFALLWVLFALGGLPAGAVAPVVVGAGLVTAALLALAWRPAGRRLPERERDQPADWLRRVGWVNLAEVLAIVAIVVLVPRFGSPESIAALIAVAVGLHFFPHARSFDEPVYRWTGAGLCLAGGLGLAALLLGPTFAPLVAGLLAATVLWLTSWRLGRSADLAPRPAPDPGPT